MTSSRPSVPVGYKNQRLSHIPIVLLTAKGDRHSRIKGWDAFVDEFLTKPFHAEELIKRLNNLLQIRAIVAKNNLAGFEAGEVGEQMSERDRTFTKNLQQVLAQEFANSAFNRAEMASKLAVSERQLQRKTTALFHQSPSALLRIYQLHQAQALLKQGNRVGEVADACGFTLHSQFSQHYRKQFGTSPKTHHVHQ